jgi:hypothetical protein
MSENTPTELTGRASILADLWLNYRNDEQFTDFIEYNDLGLPLAYALANDIITTSPTVERFVNETFDLLLAGLEIDNDYGFESLDDLLDQSE